MTTQTIYGLICDAGDGSSHMRWFRNRDKVDQVLEDDESYYANEGSPAMTLTFPAELDLAACGFRNFCDNEG